MRYTLRREKKSLFGSFFYGKTLDIPGRAWYTIGVGRNTDRKEVNMVANKKMSTVERIAIITALINLAAAIVRLLTR